MVKKYKDLDIAVVSKVCDKIQAQRIRKYCKLYIHTNQRIECKVAIINYDTSIIDYINKEAKIYETIHGDYSNIEVYKGKKPPTHDRITGYIAITKYLQGKVKELIHKDNVIMCYNPLTVEQEEKPLILVSATRLHKYKGVARMQKLVNALDSAGINYIWYVISNDIDVIKSPNVIFIKNRLDISKWLTQADYVVLLSDSEACSYTLNEALYRNIPIISTPLPYLKEIGVKDGVNSYIMEFDCSNVNDIVNKIQNVPKFKFEKLKDDYINIFAESKSRYEEERKMKVKVKAIIDFSFGRFNEIENLIRLSEKNQDGYIYKEDIFICTKEIADYLVENNAVEIIEKIKEVKEKPAEKVEEKVEKTTAKKKTTKRTTNSKKNV